MNKVEASAMGVDAPEWTERAVAFCIKALSRLGLDGWELSVAFTDDATMRGLNARFRGKDRPTDVLSFAQDDGDGGFPVPVGFPDADVFPAHGGGERFLAGDIVISLESLASNAREFSVPADEELKRLLVHGILHLSGMDHDEEDPRGEMLDRQEALLAELREEKIL